MGYILYSLEKGEKWLTPFEKRQWREKVKALSGWFEDKGIEISPWLQIRLRELLVLMFFIQRCEHDVEKTSSLEEEITDGYETVKRKHIKQNETVQKFEMLFKYLERLRDIVAELERIKPSEPKHVHSQSISELVQDLLHCEKELEKGRDTLPIETGIKPDIDTIKEDVEICN
ncbi:MAG TPA: hypothetical protein PLT82_11160 [Candidatus Hydrogenedens sp.]|nr:hypothetical protein [Candidatus Hydrogenedens sp.]HOK10574.1 hypothetical protein [Candidatus Hydrogenedens sp.]HOL20965.1 hypothetical protein [Candidatus Hydrogenedens sp.]HPP59681.1 hypothetical protein [Candidatus Hydrogenedens sp.]